MKEKLYQVAIDTHKFYDEISMKLIAGIITITGATFFINEKTSLVGNAQSILFIVVAFITFGLLLKYRRSAYYANVARNVAAYNETNEQPIGVSHVFGNPEQYPDMHKPKRLGLFNIYGAVHFVWFTCFAGLCFAAYIVS